MFKPGATSGYTLARYTDWHRIGSRTVIIADNEATAVELFNVPWRREAARHFVCHAMFHRYGY
jgi:hypothetical protein